MSLGPGFEPDDVVMELVVGRVGRDDPEAELQGQEDDSNGLQPDPGKVRPLVRFS